MTPSVLFHLPWIDILEILDIPVIQRWLPTKVLCPLCNERRLTIYEDTISKATWHYCFDCGSNGDIIELAAAVWGMNLKTTIYKLADIGIPIPDLTEKMINDYLKKHPHYRKRVNRLWSKSKEYIISNTSPGLNNIRRTLHLTSNFNKERWISGPGILLGANTVKEINIALHSGNFSGASFGRNGMFKGTGWRELLMTPYYSTFERICGFAFVGREATKVDKLHYFTPYSKEAGLAGLFTTEASKTMFGRHIIAVNDPWFMLRLQLRHFISSNVPLPLVAWHDDSKHISNAAWKSIDNKIPVFWAHDELIPFELIHQAIITNGMIVLIKKQSFDKNALESCLRSNEPRDIFRRLILRAKPWKDLFEEWANEMPDGPIEEILQGLKTYGHDIQSLFSSSRRLRSLIQIKSPERSVRLNNSVTITEKNGKWWSITKQGTMPFMNAVVRIDKLTSKDSVPAYKGKIIFKGQTIPFEIPVYKLESKSADYFRSLILESTGEVLYVAPRSSRKVLDTALAFARQNAGIGVF